MNKLKQKPPTTPKKTKYIVKDVFKEPDPEKRNEKVLEIMKKTYKKSLTQQEPSGTNQKKGKGNIYV